MVMVKVMITVMTTMTATDLYVEVKDRCQNNSELKLKSNDKAQGIRNMNDEESALLFNDSLTLNREKDKFTLLSLLTASMRIIFSLPC